ncbi:MAG: nucleoside deaminase [Ruminococcaceae bacterium]|nr:nucleoside deaminase [Oscillospiraceae bacterium]
MREAIREAEIAASLGEVPIGAVVVWDGEIVSRAHNTRETEKNALGHAECSAIAAACEALGGWRLHRATLYVTLEPCPMCAGAIVNARVARVVYGAKDARAGAFGSVLQLNNYPLNHRPQLSSGVCEEECRALMTAFFASLRQKRIEGGLRRKKKDFMPKP